MKKYIMYTHRKSVFCLALFECVKPKIREFTTKKTLKKATYTLKWFMHFPLNFSRFFRIEYLIKFVEKCFFLCFRHFPAPKK